MKIIYIGNQKASSSLTPTTIDTLSSQLQLEGVDVIKASPISNKLLRLIHMTFVLIFQSRKVKMVLIDTYSSSAFLFCINAAFWSRLLKKPYAPILHGGNLKWRIEKSPWWSDFVFKNAKVNIGVSHFFEETFRSKGYPFTVIPNNIEVGDYPFQLRKKIAPRILWVRSFARLYHPNLALDILKILIQKYPESNLTMIGPDKDGSMQEFMEYSKLIGIEKNVEVLGLKTKPEWREISKKNDIFLSTTTIDNTPVSVIEAMALGLPVVSTRVGGVPFIISHGKNGLLYESGNAEEAAQFIFQLLENPDFTEKISLEGRATVENWDWKVIKNQWKNLLDGN